MVLGGNDPYPKISTETWYEATHKARLQVFGRKYNIAPDDLGMTAILIILSRLIWFDFVDEGFQ